MKSSRRFNLSCLIVLCALAACQAPGTTPLPPAPTPAPAGTVLSQVPMSFLPSMVSAGAGALWYSDYHGGVVARVDTATNKVVATIVIGDPYSPDAPYGTPTNVAVEGQTIWVTDNISKAVIRIDPVTNAIAERIPLTDVTPTGAMAQITPLGLALDGSRLWVGDFDQSVVLQVDTISKQVLAAIPVDHPTGIAIAAGAIWVVQHRKDSLVRIDPTTNKIVAIVPLPGQGYSGICGMCVEGLAANAGGVWVPLRFGKGVARIDPQTNKVVAFIPFNAPVDKLWVSSAAVWATEGPPLPLDCPPKSSTAPEECGTPDSNGQFHILDCTTLPGFVVRIDPSTNTVVGKMMSPCPVSAIVSDGDLWVGSGNTLAYAGAQAGRPVVLRLALGR